MILSPDMKQEKSAMAETVMLSLDLLSLACDTQIRVAVDEATVLRYAILMETKEGRAKFPPIVVYLDENGKHWIADGHHRIIAAIRCNLTEILAEIRSGSRADALWAAAEINSKNALPLKENDIRKAIGMLLEAWPNRSNTMIANVLGCTEGTVRYHLKQVRNVTNLTQTEDSTKRVVGKDGKSYPARRVKKAKSDSPKLEPVSDMPSQESSVETNPESQTSSPSSSVNEKMISSAKHSDESFEYESPYTELPRNKDGVEVVPPLPSTTSPIPRIVPASLKNWPHDNEDTIIIGEGEKEKTEPLYYGGFRPTPQIPCPGGYGSRPIGQTTLKHIPREHPNRLTATLFTWFPPGYVVEMVLDAMQQLQNKDEYGPQVTDWIMRQLNKKYGAHAKENDVAATESVESDHENSPCPPSGERLNECTPSEYVRHLTISFPEWFTHAILGNLLTLEQEKRVKEMLNESNGPKRRIADPIISELFHRLDHQDQMTTFAGMFDKLLHDRGTDIPKLMDSMTQKIQRQTAKSKPEPQDI